MKRFLLVLSILSICSCVLFSSDYEHCIFEKGTNILIKRKGDKVVKLATWNIGHFSNGSKKDSKISSKSHDVKLDRYRELVYDSLEADVLCLQEYSQGFGVNSTGMMSATSSVLFDGFKIKYAGIQRGFRCNAIFSNVKMKHVRMNEFKCNSQYTDISPSAKTTYYTSADLYIGGENVKIVCLHLAFSKIKGYPEVQQNQIKELISRYEKYERVIMCGDWNTTNYILLKEAGYILANNGTLKTYSSTKKALDNIAVKGLKIRNIRMIVTDLSDHYPLICEIVI